jgi:hypothetical protein
MWQNIIENKMNLNFDKFNYILIDQTSQKDRTEPMHGVIHRSIISYMEI